MKIKYLGHSSFLITADNGTKIITDPYHQQDQLSYKAIDETADVVTVTHEHGDHNNTGAVKGSPVVLRESKTVKGIEFQAIPAFHDGTGGRQRGKDTIFCFSVDGVRVCHLGDLGHILTDEQAGAIGKADVLLIPVGGFYTIDADGADKNIAKIKPRVVIPMHFKTEKTTYPIATIEEFLKDKKNVTRLPASETEFKIESLPENTQIIVLRHAN